MIDRQSGLAIWVHEIQDLSHGLARIADAADILVTAVAGNGHHEQPVRASQDVVIEGEVIAITGSGRYIFELHRARRGADRHQFAGDVVGAVIIGARLGEREYIGTDATVFNAIHTKN